LVQTEYLAARAGRQVSLGDTSTLPLNTVWGIFHIRAGRNTASRRRRAGVVEQAVGRSGRRGGPSPFTRAADL